MTGVYWADTGPLHMNLPHARVDAILLKSLKTWKNRKMDRKFEISTSKSPGNHYTNFIFGKYLTFGYFGSKSPKTPSTNT